MSIRVRRCFIGALRSFADGDALPRPVLKGTMRRAVVVRSPDERFTEAVFILKDSILREQGVTPSELVAEAREAAADCTGKLLGRRRSAFMYNAAVFISGAASAIIALWAAGLLG